MSALAHRECYCPGHFGNSYEVMHSRPGARWPFSALRRIPA